MKAKFPSIASKLTFPPGKRLENLRGQVHLLLLTAPRGSAPHVLHAPFLLTSRTPRPFSVDFSPRAGIGRRAEVTCWAPEVSLVCCAARPEWTGACTREYNAMSIEIESSEWVLRWWMVGKWRGPGLEGCRLEGGQWGATKRLGNGEAFPCPQVSFLGLATSEGAHEEVADEKPKAPWEAARGRATDTPWRSQL